MTEVGQVLMLRRARASVRVRVQNVLFVTPKPFPKVTGLDPATETVTRHTLGEITTSLKRKNVINSTITYTYIRSTPG